jgi:hypothetical protein
LLSSVTRRCWARRAATSFFSCVDAISEQIATARRTGCDHLEIGPMPVDAQSKARMRAANVLLPSANRRRDDHLEVERCSGFRPLRLPRQHFTPGCPPERPSARVGDFFCDLLMPSTAHGLFAMSLFNNSIIDPAFHSAGGIATWTC